MAIKKEIEIVLDADKATADAKKFGNTLEGVDKEAKKVSDSVGGVADNGGAIAILDSLTGGLATTLKDAYEASKLFNFSLKATRGALIATGIGAFVVALGLVVAYWDEIVDFITDANKELEEQNKLLDKGVELLKLQLAQNDLLIKAYKAQGKEVDGLLTKSDKLLQTEQLILLNKLENLRTLRLSAIEDAKRVTLAEKLSRAYTLSGGKEGGGIITKEEQAIIDDFNTQIISLTNELIALGIAREDLTREDIVTPKDSGSKPKVKAVAGGLKSEGIIDSGKEEREREVKRLSDIFEIRERYRLLQEEADAINQLEKDELSKDRALMELEALNATEAQKAEVIKFWDDKILEDKKELADKEIDNEEIKSEAIRGVQNASLDAATAGFNLLASLNEKSKGLQAVSIIAENAAGIAKNIINTTASNARLTLETGVAAPAAIAANNIRMGIGIAASIAATVRGLSQLGKSGGGGAVTSGGGGGVSAPSFNLVEGSGTNQIAQGLQGQDEPVRAYVVSGDVTTSQSLERNIQGDASLG